MSELQLKIPIGENVLSILSDSIVTEQGIKLTCGQLERHDYEQVNEVLERIGGKWNGSKKQHLFSFDVKPLLTEVLKSGMMPPKNPLAYFPTPLTTANLLLDMIDGSYLCEGAIRVLEPSAGQGALIDALKKRDFYKENWQIEACEMDSLNRSLLNSKNVTLMGEDFLSFSPAPRYSLIVMNPPFAVEKDRKAFITHIMHAWGMLNFDGQLVAITPMFDFQTDSKTSQFKNFVKENGYYDKLPPKSFSESGTNTNTCRVWLQKIDPEIRAKHKKSEEEYMCGEVCGYPSGYLYHFFLWFDTTYECYQHMERLRKKKTSNQEIRAYLQSQSKESVRLEELDFVLREEDLDNAVNEILNRWENNYE